MQRYLGVNLFYAKRPVGWLELGRVVYPDGSWVGNLHAHPLVSSEGCVAHLRQEQTSDPDRKKSLS